MAHVNVTLYDPHEKQREVHRSRARFKVVNFSRRAGKSTLGQNYILHPAPGGVKDWPVKGALEKPGRYWIIAPTYTQAKSVYWRGLMFSKDPADTTAIPKALIKDVNNSELIITLVNGSTIELKGADNPDSLRGAGIMGMILDEYAFWNNPDAWDYVLRPALSDTGGWAVFISTPNGFNHFYDMAQQAMATPNWSYHHATIEQNPNIPEDEKAELQATLDEDTYAQEYMAEFRKMKGLVYPEFRREIHIFDPNKNPIPLGGTWHLGVDPGLRDELAGVFIFIDNENNWYLTDELYERGLDSDRAYKMIKNKMGSNYFSTKVVDSANATFIQDMNAIYALGVVPVKKTKDSILEGIRLNRELLKVLETTGKPKFFVAQHCKNFVAEIESYRYPESKPDKNEGELPIDNMNHLMDAWRYVRLHLYLPQQPLQRKRQKLYHPITGRIIGYGE